jgi:hypothetical protein
MEIQKMEDRRSGGAAKFAVADHAADAWDALDLTDLAPLAEWLKENSARESEEVYIPSERPVYLPDETDLFLKNTVFFGKDRRQHMDCQSRGEAELVARIAGLGVTGEVCVPKNNPDAVKVKARLDERHDKATQRLRELAASRSGESDTQDQVFELLERWYVLGKPAAAKKATQISANKARTRKPRAPSANGNGELAPDIAEALARLDRLDTPGLREAATPLITPKQAGRLADLNRKAQDTGLSDKEEQERDRLLHVYEKAMVVRAKVLAELHKRGEDISEFVAP